MLDETLTYGLSPGRRDGTTILKLTGPLTLSTIFLFQDEFRSLKPQVLILDLSDTPYMDSAGLGLIMNYYVAADNSGRHIVLAGVGYRISALLQTTRVDTILKSYPSVADAEASL